MKWSEFLVKLLVILISALYPFILISLEGEMVSISQYWNTSLQPLFITANVITGYFFFTLENWKLPSFLLILLTAFSVKLYPITHNVIAVAFFISCLIPLFRSKRFRFYIPLYFTSIIIGYYFGLLWLEICGIIVLCAFHLHSLIYTWRIFYEKEKIEQHISDES